jgi:hypothetical protein
VRGLAVLKVLTVVMGLLILVGTGVVVVTIARRSGGGSQDAVPVGKVAVTLNEPAGTRIGGIAAVADRLAVLLQGGGEPDRVALVDPRTGAELGRVSLGR